MWETSNIPPDFYTKHMTDPENYDFNIPPGMARFGTMKMPPIKELLAHQERLGNKVNVKTFGMHRTDTIDYDILLSGEITLILEDGAEKTLQPGDCVVLRGAQHAWHNRGTEPCYMAWVLIGAEPLK